MESLQDSLPCFRASTLHTTSAGYTAEVSKVEQPVYMGGEKYGQATAWAKIGDEIARQNKRLTESEVVVKRHVHTPEWCAPKNWCWLRSPIMSY